MTGIAFTLGITIIFTLLGWSIFRFIQNRFELRSR
jgi:hypothetical protein